MVKLEKTENTSTFQQLSKTVHIFYLTGSIGNERNYGLSGNYGTCGLAISIQRSDHIEIIVGGYRIVGALQDSDDGTF